MLAPIRPRPTNPIRIATVASVVGGRRPAGPAPDGRAQLRRERLAQRDLERGEPALRVGEVDAQDRQVVRLDRREVALGLGVDQPAERVRPARDRPVGRDGPTSAGGTSRSARRPCGAGRSSGGSAARSRRSSRSGSRRGAGPGSGRIAASRRGRRGDERLEREIGVRLAPGEVAGQLADERAVAGGQAQRRVAVERQAGAASATIGGGGAARRSPDSAAARTLRVSSFASSTFGWSNGSIPRTAPAIAVATSQRNDLRAEVDRVGDRRSG